jgi:hypothetical protein
MKLNRRWVITAACLNVVCLFCFLPYVAAGLSVSRNLGFQILVPALTVSLAAPVGFYLWWGCDSRPLARRSQT